MGSAKIIPADAGSDHAIKPCRPYERRREVYKEGSSRSNPYVAEPVAYSKGVAGRGERPHNEDIQAANAAFHGKHLSQPYSQSLNHKTADCEMGISSATNLPDSAVSGTATAQALPIPPLFENFADTWTPYPSFTEIFRLVLHLNRLMHDIVVKKDGTFSTTWMQSADMFQYTCEDLFIVSKTSMVTHKMMPNIQDELCFAAALLDGIKQLKAQDCGYFMHQYSMAAVGLFGRVKSFVADALTNRTDICPHSSRTAIGAVPYTHACTWYDYSSPAQSECGPHDFIMPYAPIYAYDAFNTESMANHRYMPYTQIPAHQHYCMCCETQRWDTMLSQKRCARHCTRGTKSRQQK